MSSVDFEVFAEKRPTQMNFDEAPFYLAVNNIKTDSLDKKPWFKQSPVGVNKLNSIMKVMSEKAELNKPRLKNHSGRKTMMQTLVNEEIPPSDIIQLSGHRNLQSVNNYATVSEKQQMKMSRTLSAFTTGIVSKKDAPREESSCGSSSENNKMHCHVFHLRSTTSATNFRWSYDKRQHTQQISYIADKPEA